MLYSQSSGEGSSLRRVLLFAGIPLLLLALSRCQAREADAEEQRSDVAYHGYWAHTDTVSYVGAETCRACHSEHFSSYMHTGMGRSWGRATKDRSDADYSGHPIVRDPDLDLTYHPHWRGDSLVIAEYRIEGGDTTHYREEIIDWIVGSGHHTNSHLIERDGYLTQAPITFYTQRGQWDLAPGFEDGFNSRFSRMIETECITCHNGLPEHRSGSLHAYEKIPSGIDCERCHGPGAEHVRRTLAGNLVDTSTQIDYSIVNPGKLSVELQLDLCQRCHLQGIAVLQEGVDWFDFQPGERLADHWNIFLPRFSANTSQFLMASQAERLRKSECYVQTGAISCITCHNPHHSVKETSPQRFDQACIDCHGGRDVCTESLSVRELQADHCSGCHMPAAESIDIPHVSITDHRIAVPGRDQPQDNFEGLECLTDEHPSSVSVAAAYLKFFEAFKADPAMLDSAAYWINQAEMKGEGSPAERFNHRAHLLFLREDHPALFRLASSQSPQTCQDAWTCYRIGEACAALGRSAESLSWFSQAVDLLPQHPEFRLKKASGLVAQGSLESAIGEYEMILSQDSRSVPAMSNLGFLLLQRNNAAGAETLFRRACSLDPNYIPARTNLIQLLAATNRGDEARVELKRLSSRHSADPVVQALEQALQ